MKSPYPVASEARAFSFLQLQCSFAGGHGVPSERQERSTECLFRGQDHVGVQFFQQLSHFTKVSPKQIWTGTIYSRPSVSAWSWFLEPHTLPHTKIHGCSSVLCKMASTMNTVSPPYVQMQNQQVWGPMVVNLKDYGVNQGANMTTRK